MDPDENETPELPAEMVVEIVKRLPFKDQLKCRLIWPEFDEFIKDILEGRLKPLLLHPWKNEGFIKHLEANPYAPIPNELHLESGSVEEAEKVKEVCEVIQAQGRKIKTLKVNFNKNNSFELQKLRKALDANYDQKYLAANSDLLLTILQMFGSTLETLELVEIPRGYAPALMENQTPIVLTSLKKIILSKFSDNIYKGKTEQFSPWFQRLFQAAPKLRWIKETADIYPVNILNDLRISEKLCRIPSIHLHRLRKGHLSTILELKDSFALQELIINEFKFTGGEAVLKFQEVLGILKLLRMDFSIGNGKKVNIKFPVMQKLTDFGFDVNLFNFDNLCWKNAFPKLKYLEIRKAYNYRSIDWWRRNHKLTPAHWLRTFSIEKNRQPCTTVEVMKIDLGKYEAHPDIINGECCASVAAIFPCVKILTVISPSEAFFKGFTGGWQNVTELELFLTGYIDLDEELFGMSRQWKTALGKVDKKKKGCWTSTNPPGEPAWTICNLRNLTVLKLKKARWCRLTEFAFFFGLVRLTNLEKLDLTLPKDCKIAKNPINFLKAELPALVIQIQRT